MRKKIVSKTKIMNLGDRFENLYCCFRVCMPPL
jgi:hypothetical protein